ncbi:hypothetical protein BC833DRAFT_609621 [Globomyces pollinis-pini]|nr:hypothetical protein BC833DRAFT_609621 [Globomyces pollinis-pini]
MLDIFKMNETVNICYQLTRDDLTCCICYEDIRPPIIQYSSGNHFVCGNCSLKLTSALVTKHQDYSFIHFWKNILNHNLFIVQIKSVTLDYSNGPWILIQ